MGSWTHKPEKRQAAKEQRQQLRRFVAAETAEALRRRAKANDPPEVDAFGNTIWPDSFFGCEDDTPNASLSGGHRPSA